MAPHSSQRGFGMSKRVLVLSGSPTAGSFSEELADTYSMAAQANFSVRQIKISQLDFTPTLHDHHYTREHTINPAIRELQQSLHWAEHILITTPVWWGALPAKFRQMIGHAVADNGALTCHDSQNIRVRHLRHKTARIIMAMDAPPWHYKFVQGAPAFKQLALAKLRQHGIKKAKYSLWGPVGDASQNERNNWMLQAMLLGKYAQ